MEYYSAIKKYEIHRKMDRVRNNHSEYGNPDQET